MKEDIHEAIWQTAYFKAQRGLLLRNVSYYNTNGQ